MQSNERQAVDLSALATRASIDRLSPSVCQLSSALSSGEAILRSITVARQAPGNSGHEREME